jgi:hypothetical protein
MGQDENWYDNTQESRCHCVVPRQEGQTIELSKELVRPKARPFSDIGNSTTGDPKSWVAWRKASHLFGITRFLAGN